MVTVGEGVRVRAKIKVKIRIRVRFRAGVSIRVKISVGIRVTVMVRARVKVELESGLGSASGLELESGSGSMYKSTCSLHASLLQSSVSLVQVGPSHPEAHVQANLLGPNGVGEGGYFRVGRSHLHQRHGRVQQGCV